MAMPTPEPVKVFISYSHKDEIFREQLQEHLYAAKRQGLIEDWHDRKISSGEEWGDLVDENQETSEIILLLVSPSFIASPYSYNKEMQRALEKHEAGQARVIPIILRPVDWSETPFARLQALPSNGRPITRWSNRNEAWMDVAKGIRAAVKPPLERHEPVDYSPLAGRTPEAGTVYVCPRGDYEWSQQSVGERMPTCPHHGIALVPKDTGRKERLDTLYAQARQAHQNQEWHAVLDIFAEIHAEDPAHPDPEELLQSARNALERARKERETVRQYREAVEWAFADEDLNGREVKRLSDLENRLELSSNIAASIERDIMGETKEAILERQEQEATTNPFVEADRRYAELKRRHEAGTLTDEEFDERLKQLMVQDKEDRWWVKSRTTGEWHYYDGTVWIKDTPPGYEPLQGAPRAVPSRGYERLAGYTPEAGTVYVCPRGDYTWSQQSVGEQIPKCPTHGIPLEPRDQSESGESSGGTPRETHRPWWRRLWS